MTARALTRERYDREFTTTKKPNPEPPPYEIHIYIHQQIRHIIQHKIHINYNTI